MRANQPICRPARVRRNRSAQAILASGIRVLVRTLSQLARGQLSLILTVRATVTQLATSPVKFRP
jgi:hypothetical protein